jgi:hypothetical protein
MFKRRLIISTFLAVLAIPGMAADHFDSPTVVADPATDIADLFAWTTADRRHINLVMTVPVAEFSDAVQYAFRVESTEAYGTAGVELDVICTFSTNQNLECWVGKQDYVSGDASSEFGLLSDTGRVRAFSGLRNDPFFFNSSGFNATVAAVAAAAPSLDFDSSGCPTLDDATSTALLAQLASGGDGFALLSVQALVLQIDRSLLTAGGDVVAVWGSTHRAGGT